MRQVEKTISIPVVILTLGFFSSSSAQEYLLSLEDDAPDAELNLVGSDFGKNDYGYIPEYRRLLVNNSKPGSREDHFDFPPRLGKRSIWDGDRADDLSAFRSDYYDEDSMDKRHNSYSFGLGKRDAFRRYSFGLGKRDELMTYDSGYIPAYMRDNNKGGKRGKLPLKYDFGLGKRSGLSSDYHDDDSMGKRHNPYSFGLGKREGPHRFDFGLGKREGPHRFDFGLGKRSGLQRYNFGLGKRDGLQAYDLGRRVYGYMPENKRLPNKNSSFGKIKKPMYDFGLGKRSVDSEAATNVIVKREAAPDQPAANPVNKMVKFNGTAELESHEIMGHSHKSQLTKRSPLKNSSFRANKGFARQFRKPLYNFGLGKRTSTSDKLNLDNYKSLTN